MKPPIFIAAWTTCLLVLQCTSCQKEITWTHYVTTYVGGLESGPMEGSIDSVYLSGPNNIVVDKAGNLIISDRSTHEIRKISPFGVVVTIAGRGEGFADGVGPSARFNITRGLALDDAGNLYVADRYNHSIRKITPQGEVSTLAGNGTAGFSNGTGKRARFDNPVGIAVDASGNVYVADSYNNRIRKITPAGGVSTLAGRREGFADGQGDEAKFSEPVDLAIDGDGILYVADRANNRIRRITPAGKVTTLAGSGSIGYLDGEGKSARFDGPEGVAIDKRGILYVADTDNNRIRRITPDGAVTTLAGNGIAGFADGPGVVAQFDQPRGLAVDRQGKYLYVADRENRRIRKVALD